MCYLYLLLLVAISYIFFGVSSVESRKKASYVPPWQIYTRDPKKNLFSQLDKNNKFKFMQHHCNLARLHFLNKTL